MLFAVSICQIILAVVYYDQCPVSPFLSIILLITGIIGVILSLTNSIIHRFDAYDGANKWNLLFTCILFIYLIGSRIVTSITIFRLASRSYDQNYCALGLYWISTLLTIISYSIIIITCCVLIYLISLQKRHNEYRKSMYNKTPMVLLC